MDQLSSRQSSKNWTVEKIERDKRFKRLMKKGFVTNFDYEVPHLVGISKSGKTIYIDKNIDLSLYYRKMRYDIAQPLFVYQVVYSALIFTFDIEPTKAKFLAKRFEKRCLDRVGIPYSLYLDHLRKFERAVAISKCPPDLRFFFGLEKMRKPKLLNKQNDLLEDPYDLFDKKVESLLKEFKPTEGLKTENVD